MKTWTVLVGLAGLGIVPWSGLAAQTVDEREFTDEFPLEDCRFKPAGQNPFFPLVVGLQRYYNNMKCVTAGDCDELEELWITVTPDTRSIPLRIEGQLRTIDTRVVEERETANGELVEISRNYFATCSPTQDVYYFGEQVDIYEDGEIVSHDGAWLAGQKRARPGIIMPGPAFLLGSRYYQELAPGVALDRAEHVGLDLELKTPAGDFEDCGEVSETSPLEPGSESRKVYCPGAGMVIDNDMELAEIIAP
jgi:hypothetical protein